MNKSISSNESEGDHNISYSEIRFTIASAVTFASSANAGDCPAICSRILSNDNVRFGEDEDLEAKKEAQFNP